MPSLGKGTAWGAGALGSALAFTRSPAATTGYLITTVAILAVAALGTLCWVLADADRTTRLAVLVSAIRSRPARHPRPKRD